MELMRETVKRLGNLVYVFSPYETSFEKPEDVPDYIVQAVPFFTTFLVIELIFNLVQKHSDRFQLDDGITSITHGIIEQLSRLFTEGTLLGGYIYVYNNYRIATLPWNSTATWFFAMLAIDFAYYWVHRWCHEINLAWSGHQVHHSSEFYNLTTALRQSALQAYFEPFLYMPLALVVSPSLYLVHRQLNLLYQFLLHTEAIQTLGPLELVLNTPSHHRVHHGRDRYCTDKNFGGILIIWDRLFGTFAAEQHRPAYGLTHSVNTFDPWTLQVCRPVETYAPTTSLFRKLYVTLHFGLIVIGYVQLSRWGLMISTSALLCGIAYIFFSFAVMGAFLDKRGHACKLEAIRCALMFFIDTHVLHLSALVGTLRGLPEHCQGNFRAFVLELRRGQHMRNGYHSKRGEIGRRILYARYRHAK
ncbi:hypothetical protein V5799_027919 [Amblyomma americanum]|uniref:Alkylglycerol monooxygenase n=1 Tax=Amblyomma americanum TaxID=6943 RepID=A0AAQ4DEC7_AMBAM